ncbi:MAG: glycosyltransferase family 39 protein, partial [Anaerolineae bacterium]|nr:glycosyltransferase family 39 protein [Anaerolineae bacterium]
WGLIGALLIGAFYRLYQLAELPADLGWDLPYNYMDIRRILSGEYLIFFPDNFGREGMFFYLAAALAKLGRLSPYSMRLTSAAIGIATIPALYLLAKECFDRETGVYAALLLAVNKWHIVLSRAGYRVILLPLFGTLVLLGLARSLRRGRARDWAWLGFSLGLGIWTYKAFSFAFPLAIGAVLAYALWAPRATTQKAEGGRWGMPPLALLKGLGFALLIALVLATPMLRYMVDAPESYFARELHGARLVRSAMGENHTPWHALLSENLRRGVLMFNYEGDGNSRFGVPFQRQLGFVSGVLFILGLACALRRPLEGGNALLFLGLGGFLLPMVISMLPGETPNCFRSAGTIGVALTLAAGALRALRQAFVRALQGTASPQPQRQSPWLLGLALVVGLWGAEAQESWRYYFEDFRQVAPDVANYSIAQELAKRIAAFEDGPAFIKEWPYWYDGRAVQVYLDAEGKRWGGELLKIDPQAPPLKGFQGKVLVLLHPQDRQSLSILEHYFPRWAVLEDHFPNGEVALIAFYGER